MTNAAEELTPARDARLSSALGPGNVLIELTLSSVIEKRALFNGLRAMGFQAVVLADVDVHEDIVEDEEHEHETPATGMTVRFLGKLGRAITPTNTDVIEWGERSPISFDVFRPIESLAKVFCIPFVLEAGEEYELRFVARNKLYPDADAVAQALEDEMCFNVRDLIALRRDLITNLVPEERDAYSVWFARAKWKSTMSVITHVDPFYFADLKKLPRNISEIRHVERKNP